MWGCDVEKRKKMDWIGIMSINKVWINRLFLNEVMVMILVF